MNNEQKDIRPEAEVSSPATAVQTNRTHKKLYIYLSILILILIATVMTAVIFTSGQNAVTIQDESLPTPGDDSVVHTDETNMSYAIVDTNQENCFDDSGEISCPSSGASFFGQDASYIGNKPSYTDSGDGTVSDNITGLVWQKDPGQKTTYAQAVSGASKLSLGGYDDWRIPTIKELYSLMDFNGIDPDPGVSSSIGLRPFIDDEVFSFQYGDTGDGSRIIDSQWVTSNVYKSKVMNNQECFFGVNFADGRIKCYPTVSRQNQGYFVRYVRGAEQYGVNQFVDEKDSTVSDSATGLLWQKSDSKKGLDWQSALSYCDDLTLADRDDWRLPNAKELHSIVDYSRTPDTTNSPAISGVFETSQITDEATAKDWPYFWTSTTHIGQQKTVAGVYIAFGRAMGNMPEFGGWIDVHGAGAQRSDPKSGNPDQYSNGRGPQGDAIRIKNYVRCVADINQ